ncbi:MAG TPA: energy-coupling factor ABC transporter ATP-binding protein [Lachnospiraceae bacterium]|nr:energy-coupling factor ABC transporter ATP-binding protein [Lachnospiraceae bacterium]
MLEVKNLIYRYQNGVEALKDLSFTLEKDETIGLIGANGAGKTTLLQQFVGLLAPTSGCIMVDGILVERKNYESIRRKIGFLFHNSDEQLFMNTVQEDIAFGPRNEGISELEVQKRVQEALQATDIEDLRERRPYHLSTGQKRRVAIASILSMKPEYLIMDEPSNSLDPKSRRRLIDLLNQLPMAKVIASHDMDLILDTCQRVIVMKAGSIVKQGSTKELLSNGKLMEECDLEVPYRLR